VQETHSPIQKLDEGQFKTLSDAARCSGIVRSPTTAGAAEPSPTEICYRVCQ